MPRRPIVHSFLTAAAASTALSLLLWSYPAVAQQQTPPSYTPAEQEILNGIKTLRSLPDDEWTKSVGKLVRETSQLPESAGRVRLISALGNLATEGDAGHDTLQLLANLLAQAAKEKNSAPLYDTLARLVRYEHCEAPSDDAALQSAIQKLEAEDARRQSADFTLTDLNGTQWTLKQLKGKVVLLNFWATWCPPCRREMPDLEGLYSRFGPQGLVILAISDEDAAKVKPFIKKAKYSFPVLLDPGRKVSEVFAADGIPKSYLYDRSGNLVAQGIDRRTEKQFLAMLRQAGLQ